VPSLWIASRAAGATAFLALALDVIFGLAVSTGGLDRLVPRGRSVAVHRWLSAVALVLTGAHALALLGDRHVGFDVADLLVPLHSCYRPVPLALGLLAGYSALIVHVSFSWRRRLGTEAWRRLHYLSFLAFAAALLHGLRAGTDSATAGMQALYVGCTTVVALLLLFRTLRRTSP
jgi:methionine sulfoxide reductase heme-binding subunit